MGCIFCEVNEKYCDKEKLFNEKLDVVNKKFMVVFVEIIVKDEFVK